MLKGILLVLSACFVWGLIFIIPGFMSGFSPLEVALGRYFFLGIISCIFLLGKGNWRKFSWPIWRQAILYALSVNILYYFSLVSGLRYSSASVIALIAGISPITIAFYGNWCQQEGSYRQILIPSLFIGCGLICVNWPALTSLSIEASWEYGFGLLCAIFSLIIWNWYIISNTQFLKQHPTISPSDWSTLIGVGTFGWVMTIGFGFFVITPTADLLKYVVWGPTLLAFLLGGCLLGFICSWLGSYFWNRGSQALPLSLAGQLTIFETIFGLIFVYLVEQRLPQFLEFIGIMTILSGVGLSMHLFHKPFLKSGDTHLSITV